MTVKPLTLKPETLVSDALNLMNQKSITNIFLSLSKLKFFGSG